MSYENTIKFLYVLLLAIGAVNSAKILAVFPVPTRSHFILGNSLLKGLAENGHDVTMIGAFRDKNPPKNGTYKEIVLHGLVETQERIFKDINLFEIGKMNIFAMIALFNYMTFELSEKTIADEEVQKLMNSKETFDVVIVEHMMNDAHKAFANHFGAHLIVVSTMGSNSWINYMVGNPTPLSYLPNVLLDYPSVMTFGQRFHNVMVYLWEQLAYNFYTFPQQGKLVEKYFPNAPPLREIVYNSSLVFLNSHPSTNAAVPHVPSMIEIGGYHVKPPQKLPTDLQEFLDSAKDGAIYFSLGSHIKSSLLPAERRQAIINAFSKLKQKVLWKWEEDALPGQPANVKTGKWLPQQDILAHPNIKLFISHSGLLSTTETIYHGVPVLALPVAGDQELNAQKIVKDGFGLMMDHRKLTEETLTEKIKELLENSKYAENAKKRSSLFHDRLTNPLDTAVYWVEYVIRNGGAPHLRIGGLRLPWYKYHIIDVIACISLIILSGLYVTYWIIKKCLCKQKEKQKLKKN